MGNTSSMQGGSADASGHATPAQAGSTSNLPGAPGSSAPQPIAGLGPNMGTGTALRSSTAPAFHSGLTPPARTPSPPPPSTPPLLPYAGHLSPQNPHALSLPQAHDYSKTIVTRLIMEARLAPFYRGLEDFEEDWKEDEIARILNSVREKDLEEGVSNSVTERIKEEKEAEGRIGSVTKKMMHRKSDARREEELQERDKRERKAYIGAVECPICFLNYPSNINTSRCCQQPICTECFVQIKRGEATITHLESEPAACPFCVETEFGVIYERPSSASTPSLPTSSALAVSPEAGTSGFSQALSTHSEDVELSVGPGMAPKAQEKMRRKSVSSKAAEVVTIDQIRPDWERKLNAVKAAAARRASRRIVMRQVGDRLVPIGFTSARAPGTADFSMSSGAAGAATNNDENGSRRSRRGTAASRERDMEEQMIMEAMRLSLIDHEDHQKKMHDQTRGNAGGSGSATPNSTHTNEASSSRVILSGPFAGSSSAAQPAKEKGEGKAQKFLSSIRNKNRSRSDSAASNKSNKSVSFSSGTTGGGVAAGSAGPSRNSGSSSPTSPIASKSPPTSSNLKPASPVAPVTTLADHRSIEGDVSAAEGSNSTAPVGSIPRISMDTPPRISMDMPPMEPTPAKTGSTHVEQQRAAERQERDMPVPPTYARLNSEA